MKNSNQEDDDISDSEDKMFVGDDENEEMNDNEIDFKSKPSVYLPGQPLEDGEELVCDESAYIMYHQAKTGAPCLSFDILQDNLGTSRESFPMSCYIVSGTQSQHAHTNSVVVMKLGNLHPVKRKASSDDEDDESSSDEEDEEKDKSPTLDAAMIKHPGTVNRIRATQIGESSIAATWSDSGKVYVWNLMEPLKAVNNSQVMAKYKPENQNSLFYFAGHQTEGFALDWCLLSPGRLATGDCRKNIHLWNMGEGGHWNIDQRPYAGHEKSVEDIQWSPTEPNVMASCSVDKSIRIWDIRSSPGKACKIIINDAHDADVNVISWNKNECRFLASGGDDGLIKVWDLSQYKKDQPLHVLSPVARFKHHSAPITSLEWCPHDNSVMAASGEDDQLTLWDIAIERDTLTSSAKEKNKDSVKNEENETEDLESEESDEEPDVLPQLLFIHQGQKDIKELHWHPQLPGVIISTALTGFNIFRTISI